MTKPTIHMNGTSLERLIDDNQRSIDALRNAIETMAQTGPNGRDYYPQGGNAMEDAQNEHRARMQKVQDVMRELETIGEYLGDEEVKRMVRR